MFTCVVFCRSDIVSHVYMCCVFCRSDIARKYKAKKSEIELKRTELMRLNQEYETKMRSKEVGRIGLFRISCCFFQIKSLYKI